jgi:putative sterol carrier protein/putative NADPH-quinone reductase
MKVLAINGSPHGAKGNTERVLQPFLEGAREAGAETEVIYLKDYKIKHCIGCFTCWTKTPGVCVHKDDMPALLEKLREAEVTVYATPLYVFTVSGLMKDFMDRLIPMAQPYIIRRGGHYIHPPRYAPLGDEPGKIVLISNSGYPERHHFSGMEETFRRWTDSPDEELAGAICCAGGALLQSEALQENVQWYLDAARQAGRQVIEEGHISPETQEILDRPLIEDLDAYVGIINAFWQSHGIELYDPTKGAPEQPSEAPKAGVPLPPPQSMDTMRDLVSGMALSFNPKAAGDLEAVIQFDVTGDHPESYYLDIAQGACTAYAGEHPSPEMTIHTPADVWMAISRGELNGAGALMQGKYSVTGNLGLLMRFSKLFSSEAKEEK